MLPSLLPDITTSVSAHSIRPFLGQQFGAHSDCSEKGRRILSLLSNYLQIVLNLFSIKFRNETLIKKIDASQLT